jgi:hypothetical protein
LFGQVASSAGKDAIVASMHRPGSGLGLTATRTVDVPGCTAAIIRRQLYVNARKLSGLAGSP